MSIKRLFFFLLVLSPIFLSEVKAQSDFTQTIKGIVLDKTTTSPLLGATIVLLNSDPLVGTASELDGRFRIENVPIGRQSLSISYLGYGTAVINNIVVSTGKEVYLEVELEEQVNKIENVVVIAKKNKSNALNKMATVSARSFTVEESGKYAGSRGDVARMTMNYAGVSGANDQRNDIVIRGNSPAGLLWKIEGVDVGNPNHFAQQGTTGGPVGMLNNNNLSNSDFFTGAYPAEYGNAMSGVFDLKLRTGNIDKHEFLGQVGFNGFELGAEGPINKRKYSSFLVNYRYSTLGFVKKLGLNLGTGTGIPYYQDLTFIIVFPTKKGKLQFFGIGGTSHININGSKSEEDNIYSPATQDLFNGSDYGFTAMSYSRIYNNKTYSKHMLSLLYQNGWTNIDTLSEDDNSFRYFEENSSTVELSYNYQLNHKINSGISNKSGLTIDRIGFDLNSKVYRPELNNYQNITDQSKSIRKGDMLYRAYNQWLIKFSDRLQVSPGVHLMYFDHSSDFMLEPRLGMKWKFAERQSLNAGYGYHGKIQPINSYFQVTMLQDGTYLQTNTDLKPTKSHHAILAWDNQISSHLRLKTEVYYQYLFDVPVEQKRSSFSMLNTGSSFGINTIDSLVNEGTGKNYGIEFTLERFFDKGLYYLYTLSLFESKYKGSDGVERNTAFSGNFVMNGLIGKEFNLGMKSTLFFDLKATYAGGRRHTPVDLDASKASSSTFFPTEYKEDKAFSLKFPDYFKFDVKAGYRLNGRKITQEWIIYVENATNHKNLLMEVFDPQKQSIVNNYQLGIFPMMQYKILF